MRILLSMLLIALLTSCTNYDDEMIEDCKNIVMLLSKQTTHVTVTKSSILETKLDTQEKWDDLFKDSKKSFGTTMQYLAETSLQADANNASKYSTHAVAIEFSVNNKPSSYLTCSYLKSHGLGKPYIYQLQTPEKIIHRNELRMLFLSNTPKSLSDW